MATRIKKMIVPATLCLMAAAFMLRGKEEKKSLQITTETTGKDNIMPEDVKKEVATSELITTKTGLQYTVMHKPEAGAKSPMKGTKITAHYTGYLYDATKADKKGKKFDSSVDRNQPFQFVLGIGQVIRGWDEALSDMKEGEKRCLILPADLAYGSRGAGASIPPNATLVFEVELVKA